MLAKERIESVVHDLKRKYPEFLYVLSQIEWKEGRIPVSPRLQPDRGLYTDGLCIYYDADTVLTSFRGQLESEVMHIILHGMLGHFLQKDAFPRKEYRDVMMDVQVNYFMERLGIRTDNRWNCGMQRLNSRLQQDFSMGQYYRALQEEQLGRSLLRIAPDVRMDDHTKWDMRQNQKAVEQFWRQACAVLFGKETEQEDTNENREMIPGKGNPQDAENFGQLQAICRRHGDSAGDVGEAYSVSEGRGRDYQDILKELFSVQEVQKEDPDSIDPMFYHYGLELYGSTPLLEPLESSEKRLIHLLAIAVDVSGSCAGEQTMGKFWRETYQCISQLRNLSGEGEILLLQCDTEIQKEERFLLSEFRGSPKQVEVTGMGGTSFVPVFDRLRELEQEGKNVDALIYLTDGYGEYPEDIPDYPVYFVMKQCDLDDEEEIPEWIETVYLEGEEE